jgi:hypothetical protein
MLKKILPSSAGADEPYDREHSDENRDRPTDSVVARTSHLALCSGSNSATLGNSVNQKGGQYMPVPKIARDDEGLNSVSPQTPASKSSASRVLTFPSSAPVTMSDAERLDLLASCDPDFTAYIRRMIDIQLANHGF